MKKSKKIPKSHLTKYGNGGLGMVGKDIKNTGLFLADTALAEWAPNLISQDQYSDTKYGNNLGKVASVHESFDSQSPIRKNVSKYWTDNKSSGMNEEQTKLFNQAQPIAKTGSAIGEMWTAKGLGTIGQGTTDANGNFKPSTANNFAKSLSDISQMGTKDYTPNMYDNNTQTTVSDLNNSRKASMYPNGGINMTPNAEIEKQENVVAPNGGFLQADGPSHEQGGVPVTLPGNSMIFSDRLKLGKKTFAELNKVNNTSKEDKILESNKFGSTSKRTAELMKLAKNKNSEELFNTQEALKRAKVEAYAKKMGVTLPQTQETPQEFPMGGVKLPMYPYGGDLDANMLSYGGDDPRFYNYQGNKVVKPNLNALNKDKGVSSDIGLNNYNNLLTTRAQVRDSKVLPTTALPKFEYINDPSKGSYDEQFNAYKKVYLPGFKFGGKLPKYGNGVKFVPKMASEDQDANIIVPGNYVKSNPDFSEALAPDRYNTFGKPLDNWDAARLNKSAWDADYLNNPNAERPVENPESSKFDWKGLGSNVAMGLANNAGNIYNLSRYNKPEIENYERLKATYLDPTAAIRDANDQARRAEYNVRGASAGNAGTYLSNRVALATQNTINKDRIRKEYANTNAGIANSVGQYNNELARQEVIANAMNRARTRSGKGEAIGSLGSNIANQMMDNKKTNMDQETLQLMMKYYDTPEFQRIMKEYKGKK